MHPPHIFLLISSYKTRYIRLLSYYVNRKSVMYADKQLDGDTVACMISFCVMAEDRQT